LKAQPWLQRWGMMNHKGGAARLHWDGEY